MLCCLSPLPHCPLPSLLAPSQALTPPFVLRVPGMFLPQAPALLSCS